jgi:hypothetical protein
MRGIYMEQKKKIIIFIVISLVIIFLLFYSIQNILKKSEPIDVEHTVITNTGENKHPCIYDNDIFWVSSTNNSIIKYDLESKTNEELFPISNSTNKINEIFLSDNKLLMQIYIFNEPEEYDLIKKYFIFDMDDGSLVELNISGRIWDFQYPYIVYTELVFEDDILITYFYLYDFSTEERIFINNGNWGRINGDHVYYMVDSHEPGAIKEAHLYQISNGIDQTIMESRNDGLRILKHGKKCILLETDDMGVDAETYIYSYDIDKRTKKKIGEFDDWLFHSEFDGRYLFFSVNEEGVSMFDNLVVLDTESGIIDTVVKHQWLSATGGDIDSYGGISVWASENQIHLLEIKD